ILRRDFSRGVERLVRVCAEQFAQHLLAATIAIRERGVEEVDAGVDGELERLPRFGVVGVGPPGEAPHAVAKLGDGPGTSAEGSMIHMPSIMSLTSRASS